MVLLETQYLPSVAWCAVAWKETEVAIDAAEHYQKGGLRNRCYIAGPNGPQRLTIPLVKGKHQQTPIQEVRIAYQDDWQRQHWRSIQTAYGKAPFFEHYADDIRSFYTRPWDFLFEFNLAFQEFILKRKMGWKGTFVKQELYYEASQWPDGPDLRGKTEGAPLPFSFCRYPQVFEEKTGFLPNLSVLDLLFCYGKTGTEVLTNTHFLPN